MLKLVEFIFLSRAEYLYSASVASHSFTFCSLFGIVQVSRAIDWSSIEN